MIRSSGLRYSYPGTNEVLAFPDVDVPQGAVVVLRGDSGTGKSTWLALVAGLVGPSSGQLWVAEQKMPDISGPAADAWRARSVGFLPQKLHLTAALTIEDNLCMAQWAAGVPEDKSRIASVLDALGIGELARRRPTQLSGGQAQRAALARAVLLKPKILLADEPTASLDDAAAEESVNLLLRTAAAQKATLAIATHDRRVVEALERSPGGAAHHTLVLERRQPVEAQP